MTATSTPSTMSLLSGVRLASSAIWVSVFLMTNTSGHCLLGTLSDVRIMGQWSLVSPDLKLMEPLITDVVSHVLNKEEDDCPGLVVQSPGLQHGPGQTLQSSVIREISDQVTSPRHDVSSASAEWGVAQERNIQAGDDAGAVTKISFKVSSIVHCDFRPELRILWREKTLTGKISNIHNQASFLFKLDRKENH